MNSGDHFTVLEFFPHTVYVSKHIGLEFVRFFHGQRTSSDVILDVSVTAGHDQKLDYAFSVAFSFFFGFSGGIFFRPTYFPRNLKILMQIPASDGLLIPPT